MGSTSIETTTRLTLCASQFIRSARLLRSVMIFAQVHFSLESAFNIVRSCGTKFHHLAIEHTPFNIWVDRQRHAAHHTNQLRAFVMQMCINLRQPAVVLCHFPYEQDRKGQLKLPSFDWCKER